jgi:hypothetical protein
MAEGGKFEQQNQYSIEFWPEYKMKIHESILIEEIIK